MRLARSRPSPPPAFSGAVLPGRPAGQCPEARKAWPRSSCPQLLTEADSACSGHVPSPATCPSPAGGQ